MATALVSQLLYLLDQAFEGGEWHSFIANLSTVTSDDWLWIPPNGHRSIRDIVGHVGTCKIMYENHAFGDGALRWDTPSIATPDGLDSLPTAIEWLRKAQQCLRSSVAQLDDEELLRPRKTNWGEFKETRWVVVAMIQHDHYHAGEINHIRSIRQQTDRWAYQ